MFNKKIEMKLSDYFELRKPQYIYIKITPHKSIRNYSSSNIAKAIANTYRTVNKQISIASKKLIVEKSHKMMYLIDITATDTSFYFVVPKFFLNIALEKIHEVWTKATIEIVEKGIEPFSKEAECYSLSYKKHDALSLSVDKKLNEPLSSILSVMDIMKENDRVLIAYNFLPKSQFAWMETFEDLERKLKKKECLDKPVFNLEYALKNATLSVIKIVDMFIDVFVELTGGTKEIEVVSNYDTFAMLLSNSQDIEKSRYKKTSQVIDTQIAVISESQDDMRRGNNALSVCQAYRNIDGDNEFKYKKIPNNNLNLESYKLNKCKKSTLSVEESGQLMQIPGRMLLTSLGINHIKTEEAKVPQELQQGNKLLGTVEYKGKKVKAYLPTEWNLANCGLFLIGGQGAGKTNNIKIYARDCINAGEGIISLDIIKNCELSEAIRSITPKEKLIEINLAKQQEIQAFSYNEMIISDDMTAFEKLDRASMQSEQMMSLIDAVSLGEPLSSAMRRIFNAAATITSVLGYSTFKNAIDCLENHKKRKEYINKLDNQLKEFLEDEIATLQELDEYTKVTAKEQKEGIIAEVIGTKTTKLQFILDRIDLLRSNFKLKYMYKANPKNNINLLECMREGKVVLIKMKDSDFNTKLQKNVLVTYWITKIWLATQLRGAEQEKPEPRCNMIIDELFQAPTSLKIMEYILPQARKFALKPVISTHFVGQLDSIFEAMLTSNGSFRLLRGCTEDDFKYFKNKLDQFEYEDLREMKEFHSLDLIYHRDGYSSFITHIPKFRKDS